MSRDLIGIPEGTRLRAITFENDTTILWLGIANYSSHHTDWYGDCIIIYKDGSVRREITDHDYSVRIIDIRNANAKT